ncbi:MAG: 16S rRNA (guanine(966)-N(2))-methyltransferase RsmD [Pyrinomonadaceae bacterium]|nr:16S rRNA (guanine(966)-N(2))-methyltransferase RsmD [Pyrinomonadaceae bacterium]
MENRRPTTNDSPRPVNRTNDFRKEGDRPFGARPYQPRDNQFQPRNDRFQSRDTRPPGGDNRFQGRDDRPTGGDNRFQGRDDRPPRTGTDRFQSRDDRPRGGSDNRFQGRDDREPRREGGFQPRDNKFPPRGRFNPRDKVSKPWEREQPLIRIVSDMQITDGKHRGKYLTSTTSEKVRPTARRVREVMFRILYRRIRAGRFLDLCAGSGMVGIEAISRGAIIGTFVERSAQMCGFIKKNLESCGIKEGHGEIHQIEVVPFLKKMGKRRRFWDVVYFDPPYDSNYDEVLAYFSRGIAVRPKGMLIIEHPAEMFFPENFGVMKRWRVVAQGDSSLSFYERR